MLESKKEEIRKMNKELMGALDELEREKNISKETLLDAIEQSLIQAYKNHFGKADNVHVTINRETGDFSVYADRRVVEFVEDPAEEVSLVEAQKQIEALGATASVADVRKILTANDLDDYMTQDANGNLTWDKSKFRPFLMTNVYASGEDPWFSKKKGAIDVDRAGEGYMTNIRSIPGTDPDDIENLFKGVLGMKPYDNIYKTVAYMPLRENAGLALNVAGENPTLPADWGDMRILKGKAAKSAKEATFVTPSMSKVLN